MIEHVHTYLPIFVLRSFLLILTTCYWRQQAAIWFCNQVDLIFPYSNWGSTVVKLTVAQILRPLEPHLSLCTVRLLVRPDGEPLCDMSVNISSQRHEAQLKDAKTQELTHKRHDDHKHTLNDHSTTLTTVSTTQQSHEYSLLCLIQPGVLNKRGRGLCPGGHFPKIDSWSIKMFLKSESWQHPLLHFSKI